MFPWWDAVAMNLAQTENLPSKAGPSTTPANISPMTRGCRSRTNKAPNNWANPTRSRRSKRTELNSELVKSGAPGGTMPDSRTLFAHVIGDKIDGQTVQATGNLATSPANATRA